jgi:hypothetical protein
MTDWCIIRTSPGRTIPVAASLNEAGIEAWTPNFTIVSRAGRARQRVQRKVPLIEGIVFAKSEHLPELIAIGRKSGMIHRTWSSERRCMVSHDHPPFSVFRYQGSYPTVRDRDLDPLRLAERAATKPARATPIEPGRAVCFPGAGFDGLTGIVQNCEGRFAVVAFPGFSIPVKISSHLLLDAA